MLHTEWSDMCETPIFYPTSVATPRYPTLSAVFIPNCKIPELPSGYVKISIENGQL